MNRNDIRLAIKNTRFWMEDGFENVGLLIEEYLHAKIRTSLEWNNIDNKIRRDNGYYEALAKVIEKKYKLEYKIKTPNQEEIALGTNLLRIIYETGSNLNDARETQREIKDNMLSRGYCITPESWRYITETKEYNIWKKEYEDAKIKIENLALKLI